MPPMPWEDAAAAPAPSWTAPIEHKEIPRERRGEPLRRDAAAAASLKTSATTLHRLCHERTVALHDAGSAADGHH